MLLLTNVNTLPNYTVKIVSGSAMHEVLPILAQQWIDEFVHYPYLFQGTLDIGIGYFQNFTHYQDAAFAIACDQENNIIGFISGGPVVDFSNHYIGLSDFFVQAGFDPKKFYCFVDVIIDSTYRHQGIAKKLFKEFEEYAKQLGYIYNCLPCESHPQGHPQKPKDYYELDNIWQKLGYYKTDIVYDFMWDTIQLDGTVQSKKHPLTYWMKELNNLLLI
jgi:GNAT superfamily N-acetyltransferase